MRVGNLLEPVVDRAAGFAAQTVARLEKEARARGAAEPVDAPAADVLPPPQPEVVEVVELGTRAGDPFIEGPLPEAPVVAAPDSAASLGAVAFLDGAPPEVSVAATGGSAESVGAAPPDPETRAGLIRRMLSLYARVGEEDR